VAPKASSLHCGRPFPAPWRAPGLADSFILQRSAGLLCDLDHGEATISSVHQVRTDRASALSDRTSEAAAREEDSMSHRHGYQEWHGPEHGRFGPEHGQLGPEHARFDHGPHEGGHFDRRHDRGESRDFDGRHDRDEGRGFSGHGDRDHHHHDHHRGDHERGASGGDDESYGRNGRDWDSPHHDRHGPDRGGRDQDDPDRDGPDRFQACDGPRHGHEPHGHQDPSPGPGPQHAGDELGWDDASWDDAGGFAAVLAGHLPPGALDAGGDHGPVIVFINDLDIDLFNIINQNTIVQNTDISFDASNGGSIDVGGDLNAIAGQQALLTEGGGDLSHLG
jgi:hypothetical protein